MKNNTLSIRWLAVSVSMLLCISLSGQQKEKKHRTDGEAKLSIVRTDSLPEILQYYLKETSSKHFEDPRVPRFLIKDYTDSFVFGVGGAVEAKIFYDNDGDRGDSFKLDKADALNKDNDVVDFDLTATNLSFKVLGKTKKGVIDAFINADFSGGGGGNLCLQHAYVDIFGLRVGKTHTGFRDDRSMDFVDSDVLVSSTARKVPQVSYSHRFKNGMRTQVGVEFPQSTSIWRYRKSDSASNITSVSMLLPDLTLNWFYDRERLHLYAGSAFRMLNYYDDNNSLKANFGYAFQISGNYAFVKRKEQTHKLFFQGVWTSGMADCCKGLRKKGMSALLISEDGSAGKYDITIPSVYGGSVGYQVKFGDNTIDIAYSAVKAYGFDNYPVGDVYNWAHAFGANYIRRIFRYGVIGAEFMMGRKTDMAGKTYSNARAYLYLRYDF